MYLLPTAVYTGNFLSIRRRGPLPTSGWGVIDQLAYTYNPAFTNRLSSIAESGNLAAGFQTSTASNTYLFDQTGNLTRDNHKGITAVQYNYLNLPRRIEFSNGAWIEYLYDASGRKRQKTASAGKPRHYVGPLEYESDSPETLHTPEGRAFNVGIASAPLWRYEYSLQDHLGNTRVLFADADDNAQPELLAEYHYYPFGLPQAGWSGGSGSTYRYQYNGKEWETEFGLGWYDYGARWYDPAVGRWGQVDPLAELMPSLTPYRFGFNNPILYVDPLGLFETRRDARRWKREEGISGSIRKNEDGRYRVDFKGSDGSATVNEFGYLSYSVRAERTGGSNGNVTAETANFGSAQTSIVSGLSTAKGFDIYNESARTWRGLNGKQYSFDPAPGKARPFYGNGSTGGRSLAQSRAGAYGRLGTRLGLISMGITEVEYQYNLSNNPGPNLRNYLHRKRMADQVMNGVGFLGLKGAAISLGYNGGYIIESLCNCNIQYNPYTGDFTPIELTLLEADNLGIRLNH